VSSPFGGTNDRSLDEAPCAHLVTTLDGRIVSANRTLHAWIGLPDGVLTALGIHELLTPAGTIHYESVAPMLAIGKGLTEVSLDLRRADGATLHLLCNAIVRPAHEVGGSPSDDDLQVQWVGLDVTGRRSYERELLVVQRRLRRLQSLSAGLATAGSIDAIADVLLTHLVDGIKAHQGAVLVADGGDLPRVVATRSAPSNAPDSGFDPLEHDQRIASVLRERRAVFTTDPAEDMHGAGGSRHVAVLPLSADDRLLGAVWLRLDRDEAHSNDEQQLLRAAAEMCAQALERASLLDRQAVEAERNHALSALLHRLEEATTVAERAQLITEFVVPDHADYATVEIPSIGRTPVGLRHRDRSQEAVLRRLRSDVAIDVDQPHSLAAGRQAREPQLVTEIDEQMYGRYGLAPPQLAALRTLAPRSYLGLPLVARGAVIGSLMLVQSSSPRRFRPGDVDFYRRLADSCALALENARLFEHERDIAHRLQDALLPKDFPCDPRFSIRTFYEASHELTRVGGDWYDAFMISDTCVGLAVGDIVGGGIGAATSMGQLRTALRAYALDGGGVAATLDKLNRFAATAGGALAASVTYAELDLTANTLVHGCAGHPPPLLMSPGAPPRLLWDGRCPLLGVTAASAQESLTRLMPGDALVMYTDGLVERPDRSIDVGFQLLIDTIAHDESVIQRPELLAHAMGTVEQRDDTCVLVVTLAGPRAHDQAPPVGGRAVSATRPVARDSVSAS
jgi:serine/threonine-protein kinase RsbW